MKSLHSLDCDTVKMAVGVLYIQPYRTFNTAVRTISTAVRTISTAVRTSNAAPETVATGQHL